MSHKFELKEGAFVLSDAHYSPNRPELLSFFQAIDAKKLQPTQIILMGDIFDALFGSIEYTYKTNQQLINLIEKIALEIDVIYLEGNHDFNLKEVFHNIKIFPIEQQPIFASYQEKSIALAHGDYDGDWKYKFYTSLIRSPFVLKVLRAVDKSFNHFILKYVERHLLKKEDCKDLEWFEGFIQKRFENWDKSDFFIEGHFHQNKSFFAGKTHYINLAAFACNQRYFVVQSLQDNNILAEKQYQ